MKNLKLTRRDTLEKLRNDLREQIKWMGKYHGKRWYNAPAVAVIHERIRIYRERATCCTYRMPNVCVQSSGNHDKIGDIASRIADLDALLTERERQLQYIKSIPHADIRELLINRFILCKTWRDTAQSATTCFYSEENARKTCERFLLKAN